MSADKKQIVDFFMEKNYLVSPDLLQAIPGDLKYDDFLQKYGDCFAAPEIPTLFTGDDFLQIWSQNQYDARISIVTLNEPPAQKREVDHFVGHFKARYEALKTVLMQRNDLQNTISIRRIFDKQASERVSLIGLVLDKRTSKNGNVILTLEDPTGAIDVVVMKDKPCFQQMNDIMLDEVVGCVGTLGERIVFLRDLYFPDVPVTKELKKAPDEGYVAFISDIHVGSRLFLKDEFLRFISWLNGEYGTDEQKEIARKVKYLFIVGDIVDGIGVYPEQDKELDIKDIKGQYDKCAGYFSMIRKDIKLIICGGNHDAIRLSEPQPMLDRKIAKAIFDLPNTTIVSNPAYINIHSSKSFPGIDVLMYHGYSYDGLVANVDSIRNNGGYDRADLIMKFLLQKRHLSPTHGLAMYVPDVKRDPLVIDRVPDLFISGHIHKSCVGSYNNITTISSSCWQAKTVFQERVGHKPEPARVPVVNLRTRAVKVLYFGD